MKKLSIIPNRSGKNKGHFFILSFTMVYLFFATVFFPFKVLAYDNIVVVIDPGHGGNKLDGNTESGAIYENGTLPERDVDLYTAKAMRDELLKYPNITVYMTREDNRALSLLERVSYAQSVNADIMISVHYNQSEDGLFYGGEIFTSAFGGNYQRGNGIAQCIMKRWTEDFGSPDKGIKTRLGSDGEDYYGVIRHGKDMEIPVIIIEHGYLDNYHDLERMGDEEAWKELGILDAKGVADYYGLTENVMSDKAEPTVKVDLPEDVVYPDETPPDRIRINVDRYYPEDNSIDYTIYATDSESEIMYYGITYDGEVDSIVASDFDDLTLWNKGSGFATGNLVLPDDLSKNLVFRIYNNYGFYTDHEVPKKDIDSADTGPAFSEGSSQDAIYNDPDEMDTGEEKPVSEDRAEDGSKEDESLEDKGRSASDNEKIRQALKKSKTAGDKEEAGQKGTSFQDNMVLYLLIFVLVIVAIIITFVIIVLVSRISKKNRDNDS
ncbi:MAG: N-acetylmuramoyl-L-alanine amidase [Lachnospiraceae bacterium]|nr:N-acetylmuramoyl-L-alanine amidase [Lachnospiraceae bacterium]